ncbi:MAG: flagellar biosynthetic protein FliR [Pseudomonadota bacterium]
MIELETFISLELYRIALTFTRVGAAFMLLPGIGALFVPVRIRLFVALPVAIAMAHTVASPPEALPPSFIGVVAEVAAEVLVGVIMGGAARFFLSALQVAGQVVGQAAALSNIFVAPGTGMDAGSIFSTVLTIAGLAFLFAADLHHLMIMAIVASFDIMPQAEFPHMGDAAKGLVSVLAQTFQLGVQLSAPILVMGFVFNMGLGLINKLMMQLPVFFVGMPLAIIGAFYMLAAMTAVALSTFGGALSAWLSRPFM